MLHVGSCMNDRYVVAPAVAQKVAVSACVVSAAGQLQPIAAILGSEPK